MDDLRKYICNRGQNVGAQRKAELVAVAFALCQQKAPLVASKEEVRQQVDVDYQACYSSFVRTNIRIFTLLFIKLCVRTKVRKLYEQNCA